MQLLDRVGHLDGVGARLAHHDQVDGAVGVLAVDKHRGGLVVLDAVDHLGDVPEPHRRPVAPRHHQRAVLPGPHELPAGLNVEGRVRAVESAGRQVHVPALDGGVDLVEPELPRSQFVRVHLHPHGVFLRPEDHHLRDAADHREPLRDARLRILVELPHGQRLRGQAQKNDGRVGRVVLAKRGRAGHARRQQGHHLGDGGLNVHGRSVDVAAQVELEGDLGVAHRVHRDHRVQSGDAGELPFQRRGDRRGHGVGVAAWQAGRDHQRRKIDVGEVARPAGPGRPAPRTAPPRTSGGWWRSAAG